MIGYWLEGRWADADHGLREIRDRPRPFVHSKVMASTAFDRLVKSVEQQGLEGPIDRWRGVRAEIHDDVCRNGYDAELGSFTQSYGSKVLDGSLLLLPSTGFLPADDPRVRGTVEAIERELVHDGLVMRYPTGERANLDGLPGREGAFIACSFWLAEALSVIGRTADAEKVFARNVGLANDVGLLSEEYDLTQQRLVGNFPQAFSHVALVNAAEELESRDGAAFRART